MRTNPNYQKEYFQKHKEELRYGAMLRMRKHRALMSEEKKEEIRAKRREQWRLSKIEIAKKIVGG